MAAATEVAAVIRQRAERRSENANPEIRPAQPAGRRRVGVLRKIDALMRAIPAPSPHWPITIRITAINFNFGLIRNEIPRMPGPRSVPSKIMRSGFAHFVALSQPSVRYAKIDER